MQNAAGGMGRVRQPVLPLVPVEARAIGPSAGLAEGPDGGVVFVFGLATFVYAAGDVAGYPSKITLITIGMGEAAIAANNAIAQIRGEKVQPKYSTD